MQREAFELLEHGLKDMYDAEHKFVDALGKMVENASDRSLADGFRRHQEVTRGQVRRLERAFNEIGTSPEREECAGAKGLIEEYQKFVKEQGPDGELVDAFAAGAGLKVEHYEIASYRNLVDLAEFCGEDGAAKLLKQNLAEEEQTAVEMQTAATKLGAKLAGASATAVAGRAVGSMVSQAREGTMRAVGGALAVGDRAVGRTQSALRTAERRGRKVKAKGRSATRRTASGTTRRKAPSRTRTGATARTRRAAGAARSTAKRTTRRAKSTAKRATGATRRATTRGRTATRKATSAARSTARKTTGRRTNARKTTARRSTSDRRTSATRRTSSSRPQTRRATTARKSPTRRRTTSSRPQARRRTATRTRRRTASR
jgi:ferritin-like metal-binding protein YciE